MELKVKDELYIGVLRLLRVKSLNDEIKSKFQQLGNYCQKLMRAHTLKYDLIFFSNAAGSEYLEGDMVMAETRDWSHTPSHALKSLIVPTPVMNTLQFYLWFQHKTLSKIMMASQGTIHYEKGRLAVPFHISVQFLFIFQHSSPIFRVN